MNIMNSAHIPVMVNNESMKVNYQIRTIAIHIRKMARIIRQLVCQIATVIRTLNLKVLCFLFEFYFYVAKLKKSPKSALFQNDNVQIIGHFSGLRCEYEWIKPTLPFTLRPTSPSIKLT